MNEIRIFENGEFGPVRAFSIDGEPWFVGTDVAKALGYSQPSKAVRDHTEKDERRAMMLETADVQNGQLLNKTKTNLINESGLWNLVIDSHLPNAKKFRKWITSEVIPSIRKTGSYSVSQQNGAEELHNAQVQFATATTNALGNLANTVKNLLNEKEMLEGMVSDLTEENAELRDNLSALTDRVAVLEKDKQSNPNPGEAPNANLRNVSIEAIKSGKQFISKLLCAKSLPFEMRILPISCMFVINVPLDYETRKYIEDELGKFLTNKRYKIRISK